MKRFFFVLLLALTAMVSWAQTPSPVLHGPWLTFAEATALTIGFTTPLGYGGGVEVRAKGTQEPWQAFWHTRAGQIVKTATVHPVRLTGLKPDTDYEYRLVLANASDKILHDGNMASQHNKPQVTVIERPDFTFRTFPQASADFTFAAVADLQFSPRDKEQYLQDYQKNGGLDASRFLLVIGDANNDIHNFERDYLGTVVAPLTKLGGLSRPTYFIRGNHEWRGKDTTRWLDFFAAPRTRSTYFAFSCGDAFFIVLDSGEDKPARKLTFHYTGNNIDDDAFMREQGEWLREVVASEAFKRAKYRIVACHAALYSHPEKYMHDSMQTICGDLFKRDKPQNRLHLWLSGHTHVYARTIPGDEQFLYRYPNRGYKIFNGRDYAFPVITLDGPRGSGKEDINNCLVTVAVTPDKLRVEAKKRDGTLIDACDILPDGTCLDRNNGTLEVKKQPANYK